MKPPLPKPGYQKLSDLQSGIDSYYTEAQLLAYRVAVIDLCSKEVMDVALKPRVVLDTVMQCVHVIRSLK